MSARLERRAEVAHDLWAHWTRHMLDELEPLFGELDDREARARAWVDRFPDRSTAAQAVVRAADAVRRWRRQSTTPYSELTQAEKDADRSIARRYLWTMHRIKGQSFREPRVTTGQRQDLRDALDTVGTWSLNFHHWSEAPAEDVEALLRDVEELADAAHAVLEGL